jgi:uncharacterized tellurite resistance protein B-like protein
MQISELELKMMAKEAAHKFIAEGTSLNDTISKMAEQRSFNPHQLARVCEMANLETYNQKVASGEFIFDLADQEKIAEELCKPTSLLLDEYNASPETIRDLIPEETPKEEPKEKTASFKQPVEKVHPKTIAKTLSKLAQCKADLDAAQFETEITRKEAVLKIRDMLKVAALNGENIGHAFAASLTVYPEKKATIRSIFEEIAPYLKERGIDFSKHAARISEDAQGNRSDKAVNKQHAFIKHLDTVLKCDDDLPTIQKYRDFVVKKIEILKDVIVNKKYDNEDD